MKKIILLLFFFPVILCAQDIFDIKGGYSRIGYSTIGTGDGYTFGSGMYYPVYDDEDSFIQNFSIGAGIDYSSALAKGVWYYSFLMGPELRIEMPYSFFKFGLGYNYWKVAGLSSIGALGVKVCLGMLFEVDEKLKLGLDITVAYKVTRGRVNFFNVGPVIAMKL